MTTYMITAISTLPGTDRITAVEWAAYDTVKNAWTEPRVVSDVSAVIDVLDAGETVLTMLDIPGGGKVSGPTVQTTTYPNGETGIEAANSEECFGRTLLDLPRIKRH